MYKDLVDVKGEYNTPLYLFNYLNKHFKFELDPCNSGNKWLGLPYNFTKQDDGLKQQWIHNTFVNPPYGSESEERWVDKCIDQYKEYGKIIFILLPSKTESRWFSKIINIASIIIFPQKRINFVKNGKYINGNTMGAVIFGLIMTRDNEENKTKREWDCINSFVYENIDLGIPMRGSEDSGFLFYPDRDLLKDKYTIL